MSPFKKLSEAFSKYGAKEYSFEGAEGKATVQTRNGLFSSSYKISFTSAAKDSRSEESRFALFSNVTQQGVNKAKDMCGITG
jgi:hypothetical protein